jgi:hypothetical protein
MSRSEHRQRSAARACPKHACSYEKPRARSMNNHETGRAAHQERIAGRATFAAIHATTKAGASQNYSVLLTQVFVKRGAGRSALRWARASRLSA